MCTWTKGMEPEKWQWSNGTVKAIFKACMNSDDWEEDILNYNMNTLCVKPTASQMLTILGPWVQPTKDWKYSERKKWRLSSTYTGFWCPHSLKTYSVTLLTQQWHSSRCYALSRDVLKYMGGFTPVACKHYPVYRRACSMPGFWYARGETLKKSPTDTEGWLSIYISAHLWCSHPVPGIYPKGRHWYLCQTYKF